ALFDLLLSVKSLLCFFFFSSRRRHTRFSRDWSSDVCSSDLPVGLFGGIRCCAIGIKQLNFTSTHGYINNTYCNFFRKIFNHCSRSEERRVGKEGRATWCSYHG